MLCGTTLLTRPLLPVVGAQPSEVNGNTATPKVVVDPKPTRWQAARCLPITITKRLLQMTAAVLIAAGNVSALDLEALHQWWEKYDAEYRQRETEYRIRQIELEQERQAQAIEDAERERNGQPREIRFGR
jgi:hypothetical protein